MSMVEVSATNYVVMVVGKCEEMNWEYHSEHPNDDFIPMYKVKGMPVMSKDTDTIEDLKELVLLATEGREIEVIIDTAVNEGDVVFIQEVLTYENSRDETVSVGTYLKTKPTVNDEGDATYTGIMMKNSSRGIPQVYVIGTPSGNPEIWLIQEGVYMFEGSDSLQDIKLGGAFRFIANNHSMSQLDSEGRRQVSHVDVMNKYI